MSNETDASTKVVVINTGGTIAMESSVGTDAVDVAKLQPLHNLISLLSAYATIEMIDLFQVPSPHMTMSMMGELAERIGIVLAHDDVSGVVVTHGTDTLEETAYYLDLTVASDKPVVMTGAMRSSNELGADGPVNLIHAVRVAADRGSQNRGTLIVFNDEIHAARFVTKTHTSNVATFQSPSSGPIGIVTKRTIAYHQAPMNRQMYAPNQMEQIQVPLVKLVSGMESSWFSWLLENQIDGLVVEAFGAGNVTPNFMPVLRTLCDKGVAVVIVSRCYNGYVQDIYAYDGGGRQLKEIGCIFSNGLNGQKARIRLIVLIASQISATQLQKHFDDE